MTSIMNVAHIRLMSAEEIAQSLKTADLDQAYDRVVRKSECIYQQEALRTARLQQIFQAHENDDLQQKLTEVEAQLEDYEDRDREIQEQLGNLKADLQRAQADLRTRSREAEQHRAEVTAMSSVTTESTKILTEKLALAHEVATLKPEIEHLRSQAALNQNILAEKLALQRELSTLQVELETERRAVQRTKANSSKQIELDAKATSQLEDVKKELAKEKREAQKAERASRKQAAEWESQKTILESKLDAFRNKLRSTKEQLKETQKELDDNRLSVASQKAEVKAAKSTVANPRKRQTAHFEPDATIGTPGHNGVHIAKRAKTSALPGDKSTFSITPFLNRTMSILPDSPEPTEWQEQANDQIEPQPADEEDHSPTRFKQQPKTRKAPQMAMGNVKDGRALQETTGAAKVNIGTQKQGKLPAKKPVSLAKVMEEGDDENEEGADTVSEMSKVAKPAVKKRQKILGQRKSLFDDEDDEDTKNRARTVGLLGTSRGLGLRGGGAGGPGLVKFGGKAKTLTGFSPLKRDRKPPSVSGSAS